MSVITVTTPRPGIAVAFGVHARAWLERRRRAAARRAAIRALRNFDDYLLRDIGLSRGDIAARVRHGRCEV
jgi:uncharacterized protein YjiS (DUF1127 family)